ncbi:VOC family protein [Bacillus nitratireducens]|uniref:VOC family protein n=1 Tax=Bacillus nitratireducens TaxID=2026193 RepID=UPI000B44934F|nr:VOC family protein [Bacillus nitratireducens]PFJ46106.1 VOC family protein [Bacillus cereus]PFJ87975.1 VOC family protein [Bacillus cereus]PGM72002.1 VOC family protein [Bacillus cereus]
MLKQFLFTRIGHNYIPTTNIDTSIKWYTQNLGLKLINKFEDRGSYIAVLHYPHKNAIATLLIQTEKNNPLEIIRNEKAFPVIALNCEDIEYTHNQLKEKGIEVEDIKVLGQGEAKYFYFRDNEENLLEATWSIWDPLDKIREGW